MWLLRRCFPEKCAFVCLLMCTHGVQTLLPALWLPLLFPAWAAQAAWAGSPSERISDAAWTWRCAHLCSARHKPAGSERWMAGTSRCHPPLLTPLLPAEEEWVRTPPNFTCYTTFVFIACFCVCVCVLCTTCLPTDSDFYLVLVPGSDTDTVHTTSQQHSERQKYINIHK